MTAAEPVAAIILAGGEPVDLDVIEDLPEGAYVIAADSGLDQAHAIGLPVDLIIGDLDSVSAAALAASEGIPIEQYPADKNETDLALALDAAVRLDADRIVVVGGHGGRLDHHLANAALLTSPMLAMRRVEWHAGRNHVFVVHSALQIHGAPGEHVSLLAAGGPVTGIVTTGLRWQLNGATLLPHSSRGISNEFTKPVASVSVASGTLLVILPGDESDQALPIT